MQITNSNESDLSFFFLFVYALSEVVSSKLKRLVFAAKQVSSCCANDVVFAGMQRSAWCYVYRATIKNV